MQETHEIVRKIEMTDSLDTPLHCEVLVGHQNLDDSEIIEFLKPEKSMRDHILPNFENEPVAVQYSKTLNDVTEAPKSPVLPQSPKLPQSTPMDSASLARIRLICGEVILSLSEAF